MRVALDATPLSEPTGGIVRYTKELSRALAESFPGDEYWLTSDQLFSMPPEAPANLRRGSGPKSRPERRWWSWGVQSEMFRLGVEVFHGTDFSVPYLPVRPSVMTLHDLSPWRDPRWHYEARRVRQRTPTLIGLGLATLIVTPSESVRKEAIERFRLHSGRVVATPLAASSNFRPVAGEPSASPYFLYVGTIEPRKNISLLVEAWREVRRTYPVDLVLAGRLRPDHPELTACPGLRLLGPVEESELPGLYSGALAFLFPSLYEGFGLPVLEAMQCGAAVFASRDPAVAEVAGEAAVRLDAGDVSEWVGAMTIALTRPEWLRDLREKCRRHARSFSWARTARMTREVYEEALRQFGR